MHKDRIMKKILPLLLLASCSYTPRASEVGIYPYYGTGISTRIGSPNSAKTESYGLMVGFIFKLEDKNEKEGWASMANMDRRAHQRELNELAAAQARQDELDRAEAKRIFDKAVADKIESERLAALEREHEKDKESTFPLKEIVAGSGAMLLAIIGLVIRKLTGKPKEDKDD